MGSEGNFPYPSNYPNSGDCPSSFNYPNNVNYPNTGNYPNNWNFPNCGNCIEEKEETNQIQKKIQLDKQLVVRVQRLKNCHDVLGMVMSHAENYARMKGYKGKMEFNKYDYFYSSKNTEESLYRTKFAAQIFNFENVYKFYVEQYGEFEFAKSCTAKDILTRIDKYIKYIPKKDRNLYENLKKIINNQKTTIYEDELSKLIGKAKMDINKMDIFLFASAKVDHENEIEEKKLIENIEHKPDMELDQEEPEWNNHNFDKKAKLKENNGDFT
jgi:hypothetical protein